MAYATKLGSDKKIFLDWLSLLACLLACLLAYSFILPIQRNLLCDMPNQYYTLICIEINNKSVPKDYSNLIRASAIYFRIPFTPRNLPSLLSLKSSRGTYTIGHPSVRMNTFFGVTSCFMIFGSLLL